MSESQMNKIQLRRDVTWILLSAWIGYIGLSFSPRWTPLLLTVPVLWTLSSRRHSAFGVMFAYNLAISRGLFSGAAVFLAENHTSLEAACLWLLMVLGVSLPFALWSPRNGRKAALLVTAFLVAYVLPPISLIGVVNPLMAAGCLFPGLGFQGLAATMFLYIFSTLNKRFAAVFLCFAVVLPFMPFSSVSESLPSPPGFAILNTSFGRLGSGSFSFERDFERAQFVFSELRKRKNRGAGAEVILLPETIAGRFNNVGLELWKSEIRRWVGDETAVVFGAEIPTGDGGKYDNALVALRGAQFSFTRQRVPMPYSMYRGPCAETGANLRLWDDGILELPDERVAAVLICYEAFLTWPVLLSMTREPDVLLVAANLWWCRETSLPRSMGRAVALWGKLFGVPIAFARNI
ncbi:MAG: hypothetical protein LBC93_04510 [Synergistaceae bacterium]|jgi:hypothetical protein|nr:hypothetical protein [Synergistaceae bacterium]